MWVWGNYPRPRESHLKGSEGAIPRAFSHGSDWKMSQGNGQTAQEALSLVVCFPVSLGFLCFHYCLSLLGVQYFENLLFCVSPGFVMVVIQAGGLTQSVLLHLAGKWESLCWVSKKSSGGPLCGQVTVALQTSSLCLPCFSWSHRLFADFLFSIFSVLSFWNFC